MEDLDPNPDPFSKLFWKLWGKTTTYQWAKSTFVGRIPNRNISSEESMITTFELKIVILRKQISSFGTIRRDWIWNWFLKNGSRSFDPDPQLDLDPNQDPKERSRSRIFQSFGPILYIIDIPSILSPIQGLYSELRNSNLAWQMKI